MVSYERLKKFFSWKYLLLVVAIVVIGGLIFYIFWGKNLYQNRTQHVNYDQKISVPKEWKVELKAQNESKLDGSALLTEEDGKVKVVLAFVTSSTVEMPASIALGACSRMGPVKYPLVGVLYGRSETGLRTTIEELKKQLPLAISVQKSVVEPSVYVSCGDLK